MGLSRFYHEGELNVGDQIDLDKSVSSHISRVLRLKIDDQIELFNGDGANYLASIGNVNKTVRIEINSFLNKDTQSPIKIHLGQAISRNDRMDLSIQKAVELGVSEITPIVSERVQFRFDEKKTQKKLQHWHKIVVSACEQSGRTDLPLLNAPMSFTAWLETEQTQTLLLVPNSKLRLADLSAMNKVRLLIGPEGGFTENEISQAMQLKDMKQISLGPRILRTETAGITVISILQSQFGDI